AASTGGEPLSTDRGIHAAIEPLDGRRVHLAQAESPDEAGFLAILTDPTVDAWWQSDVPAADAREKVTQAEIAVWTIEADGAVVGLIQADEETEPQYRHASIDIVLESG